jgi:LPS O-antigen subunit length determinant protein (WzzB/FepE family)
MYIDKLIVIFSQAWMEKWKIILNRFCFHGAGLNINTDSAAVLRQPNVISSPSATS